jgi:acyl-Coa thioesterase superfamily protein/acyl-CoA thioesterase superfamily protein
LTELPAALYERTPDGRFAATELTRGPWSREHQHAGPPAALLAREVEVDGRQVARLSYDILGPVPIAPLAVSSRVLRPGRRVEQVEAELADDERVLMRLTAWRMRRAESREQSVGDVPPPPGPETGEPGNFFFWTDDVAYRDALEWSFVEGQFDVPGPATVWARARVPLVAGDAITPLQRLLVMADAASGVSAALDWSKWSFVNVDLGIHLARPPAGEWMAMDARTVIGPTGMGLCTSQLFDSDGAVGVSTQSLLVSPR